MNRLNLWLPLAAVLGAGCASVRPAEREQAPAELHGTEALVGTWEGAISTPGAPLRFILRLPDGRTGTVDVPAQTARDLPTRVVRAAEGHFELLSEVPGAPATLIATVEGAQLRGTFNQRGYSLPFSLERTAGGDSPPPAADAPPPLVERAEQARALLGAWHGAISAGAQHIEVDVQFSNHEEQLVGTLDVRQQALRGSPLRDIRFDGKRLSFQIVLPNGQSIHFEGVLEDEGKVAGIFTQGAARLPFSLARGERPPPVRVGANDVFREEDFSFPNGDLRLAATLTLPKDVARPAVAVLVSGSGPQDRNEDVFGFRIFEALAHALARDGIATLRYDDRGVGESTGDFKGATTEDFSTDAEAAVRFLQARSDVDTGRIGLIGHSEGAVIAPMVAARRPEVAFIVLLAAPAQPIDELLLAQIERVGLAEGLTREKVRENQQVTRKAMALLKEGKDLSAMEAELIAGCGAECPAGQAKVERAKMENAWFRAFVRYDPRPTLERVRCPVLALGGSLDTQVPSDLNLPILRQVLGSAKDERRAVEEVAGMNHLLQQAKTGAVSEYATLAKELEPTVPRRIIEWIRKSIPAPPEHRKAKR